jgi:hypothetical protein
MEYCTVTLLWALIHFATVSAVMSRGLSGPEKVKLVKLGFLFPSPPPREGTVQYAYIWSTDNYLLGEHAGRKGEARTL